MSSIKSKTIKIGLLCMMVMNVLSITMSPIKAAEPGGEGFTIAQTFPDANLATLVANKLGKSVDSEITQADILGATDWDFDSGEISNISGLEYFTNLTSLDLDYNPISDITPLAKLARLESLRIGGGRTQISDLRPLAQLNNLTILRMSNSKISDITALSGLTSLVILDLDVNQITDITPLAGLTDLIYLRLNTNQISDLNALSGLVNLEALYLSHNQISTIDPLAKLTNLTELGVDNNQISNLRPLTKLTNVTGLSLGGNQISDLSPLAKLTNLNILFLWGNQISDLSPLAELTKLRELTLNSNQISDLRPLATAVNLKSLNLSYNQISDLRPLTELTRLTYINLPNQRISLNSVGYSDPLSITNVIKNVDGSLIAPNSISNSGTYTNPSISWSALGTTTDTVSYTFNEQVAIGSATSTFSGNVTQPITEASVIDKNISDVNVEPIADVVYTRAAHTPKPVVKDGNYTLVENVDYNLSYQNNVNAGIATVSITGIGDYQGTKQVNFTINKKELDVVSMEDIEYIAQNIPHTPKPIVTDGDYTLIENIDYTLSYENNVNAGIATVNITGIGNYQGTKQVTFIIKEIEEENPRQNNPIVPDKNNVSPNQKIVTVTKNTPQTGDTSGTMFITLLVTSGLLLIIAYKQKKTSKVR